jgi:hypothetical protein
MWRENTIRVHTHIKVNNNNNNNNNTANLYLGVLENQELEGIFG